MLLLAVDYSLLELCDCHLQEIPIQIKKVRHDRRLLSTLNQINDKTISFRFQQEICILLGMNYRVLESTTVWQISKSTSTSHEPRIRCTFNIIATWKLEKISPYLLIYTWCNNKVTHHQISLSQLFQMSLHMTVSIYHACQEKKCALHHLRSPSGKTQQAWRRQYYLLE